MVNASSVKPASAAGVAFGDPPTVFFVANFIGSLSFSSLYVLSTKVSPDRIVLLINQTVIVSSGSKRNYEGKPELDVLGVKQVCLAPARRLRKERNPQRGKLYEPGHEVGRNER
jgi:hypothetical protein